LKQTEHDQAPKETLYVTNLNDKVKLDGRNYVHNRSEIRNLYFILVIWGSFTSGNEEDLEIKRTGLCGVSKFNICDKCEICDVRDDNI